MRYLQYFLIFFGLLLLLQACSEETPVEEQGDFYGSITGVVTDVHKNSLELVFITTENQSHAQTSDINGQFNFPNMRPGDYTLIASKQGYDTVRIPIAVDTGLVTQANFVMDISRVGHLKGNVSNQVTDSVLVDALIEIPSFGAVYSDSMGNYLIRNIPVGDHNISISKKPYFEPITFSIKIIADSTRNLSVKLKPNTGALEGYVSDAETNEVIKDVYIYTANQTHNVKTDSNGYYFIPYVKKGTYTLNAEKNGYVSTFVTAIVDTIITARYDIIMTKQSKPGAIHGKIINTMDESGVKGATVMIDGYGSTITNDTGYYKIEDIAEGTHTLKITKPLEFDDYSTEVRIFTDSLSVQDIEISPKYGVIEGIITNSADDSIIVDAFVKTSNGSEVVRTDSTGKYRLTKLPAGSYTVVASKPGYDSSSVTVTVQTGLKTIADISLTKTFISSSVEGTIYLDSLIAIPLQGVLVYTEPRSSTSITDSSGKYKISNINVGVSGSEYKVIASKTGFADTSTVVQLFQGSITKADMIMVRQSNVPATLNGTVYGEDSLGTFPLMGVVITTDPITSTVVTNAEGKYTIFNINVDADGEEYSVLAKKTGFVDTSTTVQLHQGEYSKADLIMKRK